MNTLLTLKNDSRISPEKYMEVLKQAARMSRKAGRLADEAEEHMSCRMDSGMSFYEDKSQESLDLAVEETRRVLSMLESLKSSHIDFELFE